MPLPGTQEIRKPLLEAFKGEAPRNFSINEILELMAEYFGLNLNDFSSGDKNILKSRINEAKSDLRKNNLLYNPSGNTYMITNAGMEILEEDPNVVTDEYLKARSRKPLPLAETLGIETPDPDVLPENETVPQDDIVLDDKALPETETSPENDTFNETETEPQIDVDTEPEIVPDYEALSDTEVTQQAESPTDDTMVAEAETEPQIDVDTEPEIVPDYEAPSDTEITQQADSLSDNDAVAETETEPQIDISPETETSEESESEDDVPADTELSQEQDTDSDITLDDETFTDTEASQPESEDFAGQEFDNAPEEILDTEEEYTEDMPEDVYEPEETQEDLSPETETENEPQEEEYDSAFLAAAMQHNTIDDAIARHNSDLADEILMKVAGLPADRFEMLVIDLLSKMGYFAFQTARYTTESSGSDLIHGVILDNKTGANIYIQARKLSPGRTIGKADIQDFVDELADKGGKGIFATTASFSDNAKILAGDERLMLIDGEKLANLMIANNFCVSVEKVYEVKAMDLESFSEYE